MRVLFAFLATVLVLANTSFAAETTKNDHEITCEKTVNGDAITFKLFQKQYGLYQVNLYSSKTGSVTINGLEDCYFSKADGLRVVCRNGIYETVLQSTFSSLSQLNDETEEVELKSNGLVSFTGKASLPDFPIEKCVVTEVTKD